MSGLRFDGPAKAEFAISVFSLEPLPFDKWRD
jgi:hypothetical protein